jgi:outer membrane protein OmpA-like peptidoglycan-associated protein
MKKIYFAPTLLAVAVLVAACGSGPSTTSLLDQTRNEFRLAQSNPKVAAYAQLELKQASDALAKANEGANDNRSAENIDKLAYLARQKIALTQEVANQRAAEADVANASKERDQIRIDQRTNEANIARMNADKSKLAAELAQNDAARAQSNAAQAQRDTQAAQVDLANAQQKTQQAQARAAQLEAQLAGLAAKKTERGLVITLGDVLFGTDLSRLNDEGMRTTQRLASILQENPQRNVLIEGFADSTGASAYNLQLSERRATAVRDALQSQGVARERIQIRGYGESYPVAANDSAPNRQLNRRVEIVLSDETGKVTSR